VLVLYSDEPGQGKSRHVPISARSHKRSTHSMQELHMEAEAPNVHQLNLHKQPTVFQYEGGAEIAKGLRTILADVFALYLKTKNFHWHMSGSHFRDYHLLLDEQGDQIFAMTDAIAECGRKIGGVALRSIGDISRHQRLRDNDQHDVAARDMLGELCQDNQRLVAFLRETHELCERFSDVATASLIEVWIDETEKRVWFLAETVSSS
jgi:starvation-inducible DNA-binding protein